MAKVKIGFYCIQEKKAYAAGEEYKGKRTDIKHLLQATKKKQVKKD